MKNYGTCIRAAATILLGSTVPSFAQSIQNFDSFTSGDSISSFDVGTTNVKLSFPGTILTTGDTLNSLATAPSLPNVLNFFRQEGLTFEFSEPVQSIRFQSGTALAPYRVAAQGVKEIPIQETVDALAGLVLEQVAKGIVEAEDVNRILDAGVLPTENVQENLAKSSATLSQDVASIIVNDPNKLQDIAGIEDPEFTGFSFSNSSVIFGHGLQENPVIFPEINQEVEFANQTARLGGIDRLVFESGNSDIVIDNFETQPLPFGVRNLNSFMSSVDTVLNSETTKKSLSVANALAFGASAGGVLASITGVGLPIGAAALTGQAATLKLTGGMKAAGLGVKYFSLYDPFWTSFDEIYKHPEGLRLRPDTLGDLPDSIANSFTAYFDTSGQISEISRTLEQSLVRYATAQVQGDLRATLDQGNYIVQLYEELQRGLEDTAVSAEKLEASLAASPEHNFFVDDVAIENFRAELMNSGLPEAELEILRSAGISEIEISTITDDLISLANDVQSASMSSIFGGIGSSLSEISNELSRASFEGTTTISPFSVVLENQSGESIGDLIVKMYDWDGGSSYMFPEIGAFDTGTFSLPGEEALNYHSFSIFSEDRPLFGMNLSDQRVTDFTFEQLFGLGSYDSYFKNPHSFVDSNQFRLANFLPDLTSSQGGISLTLFDYSERGGTPLNIGSGTAVAPIPVPAAGILLGSSIFILGSAALSRRRATVSDNAHVGRNSGVEGRRALSKKPSLRWGWTRRSLSA